MNHHHRVAGLAVTACALLALAGCGGSSGSSSSTTSQSGGKQTTTSAGSTAALQKCLKQHGVDLPAGFGNGGQPPAGGFNGTPPSNSGGSPPSFPGGADAQKIQAALRACGATRPTGGANGQAFQAYASCLSDHGVKVAGATSGSTPPSFDRTSAAFKAADKVCRALLPGNGSTTTTATGN